MKKRLISLLLVLCMVFSFVPTTAFAAADTQENAVELENPFKDVKETDWFYDAVQYTRVNDIFKGTGKTTFDPEGTMTRGMFVTILGRMADVDVEDYQGESAFTDVPADQYYAPYVAWAAKHGITNGTGDGKFSPDALVERQQMATFFVRYFEAFDVDYETDASVTTTPGDMDSVADYAKDAVLKLWKTGLLNGDGTNFDPAGNATRAQAATLAMRTDEAVKTWYKEPGVASDRVKIDPETGKAVTPVSPVTPVVPVIPVIPSNPGSTTNSYLVEFFIGDQADEIKNAATPPEKATYAEGTKIEYLPAPTMQNGLFLGWYYDAALTQPVPADATVTKSLKLYAKMGTVSPVSEEDTPRYITVQVAADNVAGYSFKIQGAFDASDITFINVSANNQEYTISDTLSEYDDDGNPLYQYKAVSDGEGGYVITALWKPGQTYSIKMADDSSAVFVTGGAVQTTHIRTLNIITGKTETMQLTVNDGIRYIAKDHAGLSGMSDSMGGLFTVALNTENGETNIARVDKTGTFTFTGEAELSDDSTVALKVGDIVAIYAGDRPDRRTLASDLIAPADGDEEAENPNGTVVYVEITAIDGNVYSYETAESEDVLFTPDVLPVVYPESGEVSLANTSVGGTFTIPVADMTYTDDIYAQMGLDSQTKVEAGDFIMFYRTVDGTLATATPAGSDPYVKITGVTESNGIYTIEWEPATEAEVMAAMDLYDTRNQSIDQDDKVIKEIENELVTQAIESGFVDEAAEYLTALALETDGFQELSGDMDLSSYTITFEDGTPVDEDTMELMAGNRAEITKKEVVANVMAGSVLQHFEGATGLRAELILEFEVEVDCGNDNKITISFTAIFEQEVMLSINVSGGAVWKMAWIFPYIADYQMSANLDVGTYTAIGITATAKTVRPDEEPEEPYNWKTATGWEVEKFINEAGQLIVKTDEKIKDIGEEISELMDKTEHFLDIPTAEVPSAGLNGTESAGSVDTGGLAEKYSAMMEDVSDNWIDIVRVEIFASEGNIDPLHILAYGISADFVVSATMHVTIGMTFNFGVAKRYSFSLTLFDRDCTTETIDLEEAHYNFQFYVMGTIGIRAGIEFEVAMGLFSLKLDSVGISAEVGAYAQMWGYFYYELSWVKGQDKESTCSGALFIEIGIYLSVKFKAQLFSYDKLTYNPTLYENEWPLWSAGEAENVYDFYYPESPEDISEDDFKDEETGEVDTEAYEEEVAALTELLNMEIENAPSFALPSELFDMNYMDMKTGVLHGSDFEEEEEEEDGEGEEGDEEGGDNDGASGASIGDIFDTITGGGEEEEEPHENSYPKNYDSNKPDDNGGDDEERFIIELSNDKFTYDPTNNTITVTSDELEEICEVTITWKGSALAFSTKPLSRTVTITWKNSEAARYISFDGNGGSGTRFISLKVDDPIPTIPDPARVGYIFGGWFEEGSNTEFVIPATMPNYAVIRPDNAKGVTVYAKWTPRTDIHYTVKYYLEELGGGYKLADQLDSRYLPGDYPVRVGTEEFYNGTSDQLSEVRAKAYPGFTAQAIEQKNIDPAGTTVIEIYYTRDTYTSTFSYGEDEFAAGNDPIKVKAKYGSEIYAPSLYLDGYIFEGYVNLSGTELTDVFMVVGDAAYTAQWRLDNDTTYRIERYVERSDKPGSYMLAAENAIATVNYSDASLPLAASDLEAAKLTEVGLEFSRMTVNGNAVTGDSITISPDGSTVIKLYHDRKDYTLTFMDGEEAYETRTDAKYGTGQNAPETAPTKDGWTFDAWYTKDGTDGDWGEKVIFPYTMPAVETTLYARYTEGTNTAYTVEHYLQDVTGDGYTKLEGKDDTYHGKTNDEIAIADLEKEIITGASYSYAKLGDALIEGDVKATIAADGSTVVKLYYDRTTYDVAFDLNGGTGTAPEAQTVRHGGSAVNPGSDGFEKSGYTFAGWYTKNGVGGDWGQKVNFADAITGSTTFYAKWEAKGDTTYTVNYYYMGTDGQYGDAQPEVKQDGVTDQTVNVDPTAPEGFTLDDSRNNVLSGIVTADGNLVLSVYYKRNQYTATFIHGDGTDGKTEVKLYYGAAIAAPEVSLSKTGYDFAGAWTPVGDAPAVGETMPAGDVTYNADWTPWTYTVRFNANTDAAYTGTVADQTFSYGDTKALSSDVFAREGSGYTMNGWNTAADGSGTGYTGSQQVNFSELITGKDQTVTLYAVWQQGAASKYTVEYYKYYQGTAGTAGYYMDETMTQIIDSVVGAEVTAATPEITGFTLNRDAALSNLSGIVVANDGLILRVYYMRNSYLVTFDAANGETAVSERYDYEDTITVPEAPAKTGYVFKGWSDGVNTYDPGDTFTLGAADVTLTALWEAATYTVSFDANLEDVSHPADRTVTYQGTYGNLPTLSKEGYTFNGWFTERTDGTEVTENTVVTETRDHTLYAHWTANECTITFVTGEEGVTVDPITQNYGTTVELPVPTHESKGFEGWYTKDGTDGDWGTKVEAPYTMPAGGITLYAKWGVKIYTITLNPGSYAENKTTTTITVEHGGTYQGLYTPTTTNPLYQFKGWGYGNVLNYKLVSNGAVLEEEADHELIGIWVKKTIQVSFDLDGGEMKAAYNKDVSTKQVTPNGSAGKVTLPAAPERLGYTFLGWKCSIDGQLYEASSGTASNEKQYYYVVDDENATGAGEDVEFTAQWKLDTYTIIVYKDKDRTEEWTEKRVEGYSVLTGAYTLPDYTVDDQLVKMWYFRDDEGGTGYDAGAAGATLTFEKMTKYVTTDSQGGKVIKLYPKLQHYLTTIDSLDELIALRAVYQTGDADAIAALPATITLNTDIELPVNWVSIGTTGFQQTFDGNNHTIRMAGGNYQPLFSSVTGTVKNLTVEVSNVTAVKGSSSYWGALAGSVSGTLENCKILGVGSTTVDAHIKVNGDTADIARVGALAGFAGGSSSNNKAVIKNCSVMAENNGQLIMDITLGRASLGGDSLSNAACVGGMIGYMNYGDVTFDSQKTYVNVKIQKNVSDLTYDTGVGSTIPAYIGGIVGYIRSGTYGTITGKGTSTATVICDISCSGTEEYTALYTGGIVGDILVYAGDDATSTELTNIKNIIAKDSAGTTLVTYDANGTKTTP